jgi:hypothetical protein
MGACTRHGMTLGLPLRPLRPLRPLCELMAYHGDSTLWVHAPGME